MENQAQPLILGHRGASAGAQENTLAAYALAVAQDADGIELDIRLTADGTMVLHHDPTIAGVGDIIDLSFDALREAAPHVPTPEEMISVTGDLLIDVEVKNDPREADYDPDHAAARRVVAWIQRKDLRSRTFVSSFNWDTMDLVRQVDPTITTGQLLGRVGSMVDFVDAVADRGHSWMLPADELLGSDPGVGIATAQRAGLKVMVWTVDDPRRMVELAAAGIDGIITNDPALAVATLAGASPS